MIDHVHRYTASRAEIEAFKAGWLRATLKRLVSNKMVTEAVAAYINKSLQDLEDEVKERFGGSHA